MGWLPPELEGMYNNAPTEVQNNIRYGGKPEGKKMGGFLQSIGTLLGGFNDVKQIDKDGFDFREKRRQEELARQQEQARWDQSNQDYSVKAGAEAAVGGMEEQDLAATLPMGLSQAEKKARIARIIGQSAQSKSNLEDIKTNRDLARQELVGSQRIHQIELTAQEAQAVARTRAALAANQKPSPRDEYIAGEAMKRVNAQQAGANTRAQNFGGLTGRGGRPQLRLVADGQGGTEYRWIERGEDNIPGPPTATQRETAGMAGGVDAAIAKMKELAPEVTSGPILGRISMAKQSQYPSGKEMEFDSYKKRLINLAYIESGKQVNQRELEMKIDGLVSRAKGNLPEQVRLAEEYVNATLAPYKKSGAVGGGKPALKPGDIYKGMRYKGGPKGSPTSWEQP